MKSEVNLEEHIEISTRFRLGACPVVCFRFEGECASHTITMGPNSAQKLVDALQHAVNAARCGIVVEPQKEDGK